MLIGSLNIFEMLQTFFYDNFTFFIVTIIVIFFDIISGISAHIYKKDFTTSNLRTGLWHKFGYLLIMATVAILQIAMFDPSFTVTFEFPLFDIVCGTIIFMEVCSIVENVGIINPSIAEFIGKYFNMKGE